VPPIPCIRTVRELDRSLEGLRGAGERVVFVPTMGDLHAGHLALAREAARLGPVVVSIFVNPTQFGPREDFGSYPRDLDGDRAKLEEVDGMALVFAPSAEEVYPAGDSTFVEVEGVGEPLEGRHRPGHLRGVATVVTKLLLMVRPDAAVFGQKDAQQCLVVERLVDDLRLPVDLVFAPTVREDDGLACSSRNRYLQGEDRDRATLLSAALERGRRLLGGGERDRGRVEEAMAGVLAERRIPVDYAVLRRVPDLAPLDEAAGRVLLAVAARVGPARLIDNLCLQVDPDGVEEAPLRDGATVEAVLRRWAEGKGKRNV
jgi:pantoate--beta-alanine ligase